MNYGRTVVVSGVKNFHTNLIDSAQQHNTWSEKWKT
jgi:hypothetical protein